MLKQAKKTFFQFYVSIAVCHKFIDPCFFKPAHHLSTALLQNVWNYPEDPKVFTIASFVSKH